MTTPATAAHAPPARTVGPVGGRDARSRLRLRESWAMLKPYWVSEDRKAALGLLALVVALNLGLVAANVWLTNWNRVFYNALEQRDYAAFKTQLLYFCAIAAVFIVISIFKEYYTMMLEIRWRTWITRDFTDRWTRSQAYYRIEQSNTADNPDQRISEDLQTVTSSGLKLTLGLLNSLVTLFSFVAILWAVSGPISFALAGHTVTIPGYMLWFAVLYAAVGSWITHKVGKPLIGLSFQQEQLEADFRYTLIRLRDNAEGVALYRGEPTERAGLRARFDLIRDNWRWLMIYTRRLVFVNSGYGQFAIVFPIMVAAPRYFAGAITLGGLMQISSAFGQVQGALSWFADSYSSLVSWQAASNRLLDFRRAMADAERDEAARDGTTGIRFVADSNNGAVRGDAFQADGLVLAVPAALGAAPLTEPFSLRIEPGERLLVSGPSGSGKSLLFRAMAGIWPYGQGQVQGPPQDRVLFLPQKSYMPTGTLADAVCYPSPGDAHSEEALRRVLADCRVAHLADLLNTVDNWSLRLSPGEQQRLAFGRALLQAPDYLFLDEATSALDEETESGLYQLLIERLPGTAIVSIAHRSTVARWHTRHLRYVPTQDRDGPGGRSRHVPVDAPLPA